MTVPAESKRLYYLKAGMYINVVAARSISLFTMLELLRINKMATSKEIELIKELKRRLCFDGYYIAFLLGQLTEKEFIKISIKVAKGKLCKGE